MPSIPGPPTYAMKIPSGTACAPSPTGPTIRVVELPDSLTLNRIAFNGLVQDDYGFTSLRFVYRLKGADRERLTLDRPSGREDGFIHLWDLSEAGIGLGDESSTGSRFGTMTG